MFLLWLCAIIGFGCLLLWDVVWVFWVIGILVIFTGFAAGTDSRKSDRRFKSGYKNNEEDSSDIGLAFKLICTGILVCVLAYFARDIVVWATLHKWWISLGIGVVVALIVAVAVHRFREQMKIERIERDMAAIAAELDEKYALEQKGAVLDVSAVASDEQRTTR